MSRSLKYLVVLLSALSLVGCGPTKYALKPGGDTASITTGTGAVLSGELLCIQDSSVYIVTGGRAPTLARVTLTDVTTIEIEGYVNKSWVTPVILFQVIPTVLITIAATRADSDLIDESLLIFGLPTLFTYFTFEASTPAPPRSRRPKVLQDAQRLKKYTRYPQGVTPDQLQQILRSYAQNEPIHID